MAATTIITVTLVAIIGFGMSFAASISSPTSCTKPSSEELHRQWSEHMKETSMENHESMYIVEIFRNQIAEELAQSDSVYEIHLYGNQDGSHCNKSHIEGQDALQDRSYCPWYNIINHSPDRYPSDIAEAKCRCNYGAGLGSKTACEEVHYNIRVLRRTESCTSEGHYVYTSGWQRVSVGCTLTNVM